MLFEDRNQVSPSLEANPVKWSICKADGTISDGTDAYYYISTWVQQSLTAVLFAERHVRVMLEKCHHILGLALQN